MPLKAALHRTGEIRAEAEGACCEEFRRVSLVVEQNTSMLLPGGGARRLLVSNSPPHLPISHTLVGKHVFVDPWQS